MKLKELIDLLEDAEEEYGPDVRVAMYYGDVKGLEVRPTYHGLPLHEDEEQKVDPSHVVLGFLITTDPHG